MQFSEISGQIFHWGTHITVTCSHAVIALVTYIHMCGKHASPGLCVGKHASLENTYHCDNGSSYLSLSTVAANSRNQ